MDAEVELCGFDENNVVQYITKYFGSKQKADELLREAAAKGLCWFIKDMGYYFGFSFLQVPFSFKHDLCFYSRPIPLFLKRNLKL